MIFCPTFIIKLPKSTQIIAIFEIFCECLNFTCGFLKSSLVQTPQHIKWCNDNWKRSSKEINGHHGSIGCRFGYYSLAWFLARSLSRIYTPLSVSCTGVSLINCFIQVSTELKKIKEEALIFSLTTSILIEVYKKKKHCS